MHSNYVQTWKLSKSQMELFQLEIPLSKDVKHLEVYRFQAQLSISAVERLKDVRQ